MDSFYASVEMRDNPNLRNVPMAVGGTSMLATANYEARKFGISSGMPGYIACKLCPDLVIIPCNFEKYKEAGTVIRQIFSDYDPEFESLGLDEASLLVT
jgi:DNA polymerase kappa